MHESANSSMWNGDREANKNNPQRQDPQPKRETDDATKKRTYPHSNEPVSKAASGPQAPDLETPERKLERLLRVHYGINNPANQAAFEDIRNNILWPIMTESGLKVKMNS